MFDVRIYLFIYFNRYSSWLKSYGFVGCRDDRVVMLRSTTTDDWTAPRVSRHHERLPVNMFRSMAIIKLYIYSYVIIYSLYWNVYVLNSRGRIDATATGTFWHFLEAVDADGNGHVLHQFWQYNRTMANKQVTNKKSYFFVPPCARSINRNLPKNSLIRFVLLYDKLNACNSPLLSHCRSVKHDLDQNHSLLRARPVYRRGGEKFGNSNSLSPKRRN